jgi:hypothetical protein
LRAGIPSFSKHAQPSSEAGSANWRTSGSSRRR